MTKITHLLLLLICSTPSFAQYKYPATKTVDSSDTYFGVTYKDPYRWLENMKDPDVEKWFKQQNDFTNSIVSKISGRNALVAEWEKLDKLQSTNYFRRRMGGGRLFYEKTLAGETDSKIYYREGLKGKEEFLFDPKGLVTNKTIKVRDMSPSNDGKKLAIWYIEKGKEISTIIILDVETKDILPERIYPTLGSVSWNNNNKEFLYHSIVTDDNNSTDLFKAGKIRLHKLGDDAKNDVNFFSAQLYPELNIKPSESTWASINEDAPNYIFAGASSDGTPFKCFVAASDQLNAKHITWKTLCVEEDKLQNNIEFIEDKAYSISSKNSPNFKLIATSLNNPDWKNAEIIAPEKKDLILDNFTFCKDFLVLTYTDGINNHLFKYNLQTKTTSEIKTPNSGAIEIYFRDKKANNGFAFITSWNKPFTEYRLDLQTDSFLPSNFNQPSVYPDEYKNLEVEEVEVKGHDGTMIPLSIIYKKGIKKDGSNICLMESYGSFNVSTTPQFRNVWNMLVIKGIIVAIPHVRGGGEKGDAWHMGGYKENKPNSWKDFNSCAEYLIAQKFTSSKRLVCSGGSAGGTLIGRVITERPDLYAAAICNVGVNNTLRLDKMPNGPNIMGEWGNLKDSIECKFLYELDCVAHVKTNTKYPAVICVTGWNDPRASPWMSAKFAAALQNANTSDKPTLLKVNFDGDHFSVHEYKSLADSWALVLWQCGHPDFTLKK